VVTEGQVPHDSLAERANGLISLATWRNLPLTVVRLVGALTRDPERSKRCAEVLRLARKDAKDLPSYLIDDPGHDQAPETAARRSRNETGRQRAPRRPARASGAFFHSRRRIARSQRHAVAARGRQKPTLGRRSS
jgi:hypothetical protein